VCRRDVNGRRTVLIGFANVGSRSDERLYRFPIVVIDSDEQRRGPIRLDGVLKQQQQNGDYFHPRSTFPVLSPNLPRGIPSFSNSVRYKLAIGVSAGYLICRPPGISSIPFVMSTTGRSLYRCMFLSLRALP